MKKGKPFLAIFLVLFCLLLSGCQAIGIDVEDQLRPPKNNGEQEGVQNALDAYIQETHIKGEITDYVLKYPTEGQYLSSFILLDQVQSHVILSSAVEEISAVVSNDELRHYGVAFYRMDADNEKTHINLLKKEQGKWTSIADIEGYSAEIAQVEFGDLDNDGFPELLVGWNMYNTNDKRLVIYGLKNGLEPMAAEETYTTLLVNDLTADKADDLLLININNSAKHVLARLFSFVDGEMFLQGQTDIDSGIQRVEQALVVALKTGVHGAFVDAYKDPDTTITELIYWEDGVLHSPFYHPETGLTTETARELPLYCQDVDQDGMVEWPTGTPLPALEDKVENAPLWEVQWHSYDFEAANIKDKFDSIVNATDSYIMKFSENWPSDFSAFYDEKLRMTTFYTISAEDEEIPFLKVQTTTSGKKADLQDGLVYFDETDSLYYAAWYNDKAEIALSMAEIQYLFFAF